MIKEIISKLKKSIGMSVHDAQTKFDDDMNQLYSDGKKDLCRNESAWLLWLSAVVGALFGFMLGIIF